MKTKKRPQSVLDEIDLLILYYILDNKNKPYPIMKLLEKCKISHQSLKLHVDKLAFFHFIEKTPQKGRRIDISPGELIKHPNKIGKLILRLSSKRFFVMEVSK